MKIRAKAEQTRFELCEPADIDVLLYDRWQQTSPLRESDGRYKNLIP